MPYQTHIQIQSFRQIPLFIVSMATLLIFNHILIKLANMLRDKSRHTKSMSCSTLKKEVFRNFPSLTPSKHSDPAFVPFNSERRLGRLIGSRQDPASPRQKSSEELLQKINFKNFSKIYRMFMDYENRRYSQQTRFSGQKDLINSEWKINVLALPSHKSSKELPLVKSTQLLPASRLKPEQFEKANQYLFKKLSLIPEPANNPEMQQLYSNYIQISQMNENIRRAELLGKAKTKMLLR